MADIKKTVEGMLDVISDTLNSSPEENALKELTDKIDDAKRAFIPAEEYKEKLYEENPIILVLDYTQLQEIISNFEEEGYETEIHLPEEYPCLLIPSYLHFEGADGVCVTYIYPTHAQVLLNAEKIIKRS